MQKAVMECVSSDIGSAPWYSDYTKRSSSKYQIITTRITEYFTVFNYKLTPWTHDENFTYIRLSEDVQDVFWRVYLNKEV